MGASVSRNSPFQLLCFSCSWLHSICCCNMPAAQSANDAQDVNSAAAYSESPSPSPSLKGSFTNLGAESALGSRGNKENEGGRKRSKTGSESKYLENQNQVLLGATSSLARLTPLFFLFCLIFITAVEACSCQQQRPFYAVFYACCQGLCKQTGPPMKPRTIPFFVYCNSHCSRVYGSGGL